ncbi:MAG: MBL fold metallo-hydrolase [Oscillospiraceae bacterium]|nr:MBL fold metallo-hydrolase [Oscillospiraceae bacterium]
MTIQMIPTGILRANSYLLTEGSDAVIIDCGAAESAILSALENLKLHAILLTHGHWDHILGVAEIKALTGAQVAIHQLDAPRLLRSSLSGADNMDCNQTPLDADILLQEGETLTFGNITLQVLHTPGHTQGGVCYLHGASRSLFTGDTLFCGDCGRTDLPGGDWNAMKATLRRLRELPGNYDVYPGHEQETTLERERADNQYLQC